MSDMSFLDKVKQMPPAYQQEVNDFIDYLWDKKIYPKKNNKSNPLFGAFKGRISMSPDFDAPLEEFKDYM